MLTIIWDVDDVLNNLMLDWFHQKWLIDNPKCEYRYEDLTMNPPHELLEVSKNEYLFSLDQFRKREMVNLHPNPEVLDWFEKYGFAYRNLVLTAAPIQTAEFSAVWVIHHFGRWIRSFNFVPSKRENQQVVQYDHSKEQFLHWLGKADIMIDDNPENVKAGEAMGIKSYLVSRPWNLGGINLTDILNELKI